LLGALPVFFENQRFSQEWEIHLAASSQKAPSIPEGLYRRFPGLVSFSCAAQQLETDSRVLMKCTSVEVQPSIARQLLGTQPEVFYPIWLAGNGWSIDHLALLKSKSREESGVASGLHLPYWSPWWVFIYQLAVLFWLASPRADEWKGFGFDRRFAWVAVPSLGAVAASLGFNYLEIDPASGATLDTMATSLKEQPVVVLASMLLVAPVVEEWVFRGLGWRELRPRFSSAATIAFSAYPFALLHGAQYGLVGVAFSLLVGILLGIVREKTGSLLLSVVAHAMVNLLSALSLWARGVTDI
jgi:membrane protease YdiL (CAAX protease family)